MPKPDEHHTSSADRAALIRAGRIIDWMASYIGRMAPSDGGIVDLNEHWLYMQRIGVQPTGKNWRGPRSKDDRSLDQKQGARHGR